MNIDRLNVWYGAEAVGQLRAGADGFMEWGYDPAWLARHRPFPVSVSLPLDRPPSSPRAAHHFFANLLPEGTVRQRVCAALRISPDNDFALLAAIGGDCAGALTIAEDAPAGAAAALPEPLTIRQLERWASGGGNALAAVTGQQGVRLSLAGAQDKLPVVREGDRFALPRGGMPSTHLLKFPSAVWTHLPDNEVFMSRLAGAVGLRVAVTNLVTAGDARLALVERYDRVRAENGWVRLHQEDFCQALGVSPARKYEKEGGPSLADCARILRQHASVPALEIQALLRWVLFNWLAGNADGHAKNISLLFPQQGGVSLAPFYDLVCTRNYPRIDRHLAMALGGATDPGQIGPAHLDRLAADLGVGVRLVRREVEDMSRRLETALPAVVEDCAAEWGDTPVLQRIPRIVRTLIRRARRNLQSG